MIKVSYLLRSGTQSCGCLQREVAVAVGERSRTHGRSRTPIYNTWNLMLQRCRNPNNPRYADWGGRGIMVCERWLSFENFYADMGDRPPNRTLHRVDNDGPYSPENCEWADDLTQRTSKRPQRKANRGCSEPGCERAYRARGLCAMHYLQQYRAAKRN
jgi:hypothetical protein